MNTLHTYTVTSHEDETLDCVMYRNNCTFNQNEVMDMNPQLQTLPAVLPYNTHIHLPYNTQAVKAVPKRETLNLWS